MLVLSRKIGERVVIGGGIVVQVLEVSGQRIRLGIDAPPEVTIWRDELSGADEAVSTPPVTNRKPPP
jgi:carbon storage regulator